MTRRALPDTLYLGHAEQHCFSNKRGEIQQNTTFMLLALKAAPVYPLYFCSHLGS